VTVSGLHHLPEPDPKAVEMTFEAFERLGIRLTDGQRRTLAAAHEYGWLAGRDGIARIILDASAPGRAAQDRRMVRTRREASVEAKFHASLPHSRQTRAWSLIDGGFRCHLCGTRFLRYVDPAGAASAAQDHTQQCEGGASDE